MLELYTSEPNTFFLKPLLALAEKSASYTTRYFDATSFEQFAKDFPANLESSLQLEREGPLLVHDGTVISSSFFMLEYISEALPGPSLIPTAAHDAYVARAWGQYLGANLGSVVPVLGCAKYLRPHLETLGLETVARKIAAIEPVERRAGWLALTDGSTTAAFLAAARERLKPTLARIEKALGTGSWLAGPAFSVADIDAYPMLKVLPDLAPELLNAQLTPRIDDYLRRVAERPAVEQAMKTARTPHPERQFVPGIEASRWG